MVNQTQTLDAEYSVIGALLLLTAGLTDTSTLPLWGTALAGAVGLALVWGGVRDAA